MRTTVFAAVLWFLAAGNGSAQTGAVPADFMVTLERTACFGECPVYTVSVDAKGNVTYDGTRFVRVTGRHLGRIAAAEAASLLATADRIQGLKELERQIDITARTVQWIRIDEGTLRQNVREGRFPSTQEQAELLRNAVQHDDVAVIRTLLEIGQ